jgi:integrase
MPRPRSMPTPYLRKGAKTYEIRIRVPDTARGGRFKGSHTTRTLSIPERKADNERDAYRNLPIVYDAVMMEFEAEAEQLRPPTAGPGTVAAPDISHRNGNSGSATPPQLSIGEACRRYRTFVLQNERQTRRELTAGERFSSGGRLYNPIALAEKYTDSVNKRIEIARAEQVVGDFGSYEWFLNTLEKSGAGRVSDRRNALHALSYTHYRTLQRIARVDEDPRPPSALRPKQQQQPASVPQATPTTAVAAASAPASPLLSAFIEVFIARRGGSISNERAASYRAVVRDLIEVTRDKPVSDYTILDADAFEEVQRALPANWRKKADLKHLPISDAAKEAEQSGLQPQAPKNIRKKWTMLGTVFQHATKRHGGVNRFTADMLQIDRSSAANDQWHPFDAEELSKLMTSDLKGNLYWLTRLALYTGARTNELCQLTTDHVKSHDGIHYLYFSPELRLKTGEKESCVRAVPLRKELLRDGFLDFVARSNGLLFPGLAQHSSGRYSDAVGKQFTYHLKKIGIKRPKLSFKSLRHTFIAEFKRCAPAHVETRERLIGHAIQGVAGRYGNSYEAEAHDMVLLEARARILDTLQFEF